MGAGFQKMPDRTRARELATQFNQRNDPTGWFEVLYREAEQGNCEIPWADLRPNPHLVDFWSSPPVPPEGKLALVIGCGLGDDAEQLAAWGFKTTAFDISGSAIRAACRRFPASAVNYLVADLFAPPSSWHVQFDFVLEAYTLQVLPPALRAKAMQSISQFVHPGGLLLVITRGREPADPEGLVPWPLTRAELEAFTRSGLTEQRFEDYLDTEESVRRFRALYKRPEASGVGLQL
jgi:SAM-dependent methyltransferase